MQSSVYIVRLSRVGTRLTEYLETVNRKGKIVTRTWTGKFSVKGVKTRRAGWAASAGAVRKGRAHRSRSPLPRGRAFREKLAAGRASSQARGWGEERGGWCGFLPQASPPPRPDPITDPGRLS